MNVFNKSVEPSGFGGGHSHQQYGPPPGPHGAYPHFSAGGGGGGHGNGGHTVVVESYQHPRKQKSKGSGSALSALTLLAFLFFLNILQNCLKEHMQTMNPTASISQFKWSK